MVVAVAASINFTGNSFSRKGEAEFFMRADTSGDSGYAV